MEWRAGTVDAAVEQWGLVRDGDPIVTPSSRLLPVTHRGRPAMLKVPLVHEEALGGRLLAAWRGIGCAAVFAGDEHSVVLERAVGGHDLTSLTRAGDDLGAIAVLGSVLGVLHGALAAPTPTDAGAAPATAAPATAAHDAGDVVAELPSLDEWFRALLFADATSLATLTDDPASATFLARGRTLARRLLDDTTRADTVVLHGDLHHENVLEFAPGDWRAIDPKGIVGHRAFDATAMLANPDRSTAQDPRLLEQRVELLRHSLGVDRSTILAWSVARSALSAVWSLQDGSVEDARDTIEVGLLAERALGAAR
ncbi:phosphotransferase [Plantibacter sp. VKM Ac-2880]|uniref:aminoglycoside phosphotransferase family protein n=1 Tax=Plantibacter sp. VKM Ac-2880 TaxID=2783827 RepID=UPI001890A4D3|nr:aminoglycoside phosphotransferase family protein [Plantibacter sp. VKM Ac-2880]MBF4570199.1 phosphotransferase [Plantibacter sp. VKM Ac-2880]